MQTDRLMYLIFDLLLTHRALNYPLPTPPSSADGTGQEATAQLASRFHYFPTEIFFFAPTKKKNNINAKFLAVEQRQTRFTSVSLVVGGHSSP